MELEKLIEQLEQLDKDSQDPEVIAKRRVLEARIDVLEGRNNQVKLPKKTQPQHPKSEDRKPTFGGPNK